MKIKTISLYRYDVPFSKPFVTSQSTLTIRSGLIFEVVTDSGRTGFGEAAPLPGFSSETLDDCISSATQLAAGLSGMKIPASLGELADIVNIYKSLPTSLCFALESTLSDLAAQEAGVPMAKWYRSEAASEMPINAVLSGADIENQAQSKFEQGFRTFKLKIGAFAVDDDLARVALVRRVVGADARLRLDANRAYSHSAAQSLLSALERYDIEYIEEPLRTPTAESLQLLRSASQIPIAIDETLLEWEMHVRAENARSPIDEDSLRTYDVAILKPALLGSIDSTIGLGEGILRAGKRVVVTSALDSGFGLAAALHVACALRITCACGLDTASILEDQLVADSLIQSGGHLRLSDRTGLGTRLSDSLASQQFLKKIYAD